MEKLKPCPLCGSRKIIATDRVDCLNCNLVLFGQADNDIETIVKAWNKRRDNE